MTEYIHTICKKLELDLEQNDSANPDILKKSEQSIYCISNYLKQLKESVSKYKFPNQETEIKFFKETKPRVYSKLIYFIKIFTIESKRPASSDKSQKEYLHKELNKLEGFFTENLEFYQYMRNNMTYLDEKYFVRGIIDIRLYANTFYYDTDPDFSKSYDFKVSKILANDRLSVYLNCEIATLERGESRTYNQFTIPKGKYSWTASKNAMVELIYALHASGAINDGRVDIKELALFFENTFNIDLSDVYRTFLEIKGRNQPTKFLDTLKCVLTQKTNEQP